MSTPELGRADEARGVGRMRDLPGVEDEGEETEEIAGDRKAVELAELNLGLGHLPGGSAMFDLMQRLELRRENEPAQQAQTQQASKQGEGEFTERPPGINHLGKEVEQRDAAADHVQDEHPPDEVLRDHAHVVIAEDAFHLRGERGGGDADGKKKPRAQPDGRVKDADGAEKNEHGRRLPGRVGQAKQQMQRRAAQ